MVKVFVDSGSSIKQEEKEKYGVEIIPLKVLIKDKEYLDGVDLTIDEFYNLLDKKSFPKTSLPNLVETKEKVENETKQGNDVIILTISAEKSGLKVGDVITKFDDNKVTNVSTLRYYLYEHKTGDTIKVTYIRDGKESTLDMKLIEKD